MLAPPSSGLPPLPRFRLDIVEDRTQNPPREPFLRSRHLVLEAVLPDGSSSEHFSYDMAQRSRLDAVVIAPHFRDLRGERRVILRSAVRPPLALRDHYPTLTSAATRAGTLWEVPAGLIEPDENTEAGLVSSVIRELYEEVGAQVAPEAVHPLGRPSFPTPGMIAERLYFFHVEIDPTTLVTPTEDGSVLERQALLVAVGLSEALRLVRDGAIEDGKTEIALRRLAEI
jgi:ADP-ribose pyrophosphatase